VWFNQELKCFDLIVGLQLLQPQWLDCCSRTIVKLCSGDVSFYLTVLTMAVIAT